VPEVGPEVATPQFLPLWTEAGVRKPNRENAVAIPQLCVQTVRGAVYVTAAHTWQTPVMEVQSLPSEGGLAQLRPLLAPQ
jgi:hypothetical protein